MRLKTLNQKKIYPRRYFYPLISEFLMYKELDSAKPENLPNAVKVADEVICLPIYSSLNESTIERIVNIIL